MPINSSSRVDGLYLHQALRCDWRHEDLIQKNLNQHSSPLPVEEGLELQYLGQTLRTCG